MGHVKDAVSNKQKMRARDRVNVQATDPIVPEGKTEVQRLRTTIRRGVLSEEERESKQGKERDEVYSLGKKPRSIVRTCTAPVRLTRSENEPSAGRRTPAERPTPTGL